MLIDAKVEGPLHWLDEPSIFSHPLGCKKGVYIWTVPVGGRAIVHYVGMTDASFAYRMKQHRKDYLSGMYFIYDPATMREGELKEVWRGMATPGQGARKPEFLARSEVLTALVNETLQMMLIWLVPLDVGDRAIKRIEGAIARHLRSHASTTPHMIEPSITYPLRSNMEEPFTVRLSVPDALVGITPEFLA